MSCRGSVSPSVLAYPSHPYGIFQEPRTLKEPSLKTTHIIYPIHVLGKKAETRESSQVPQAQSPWGWQAGHWTISAQCDKCGMAGAGYQGSTVCSCTQPHSRCLRWAFDGTVGLPGTQAGVRLLSCSLPSCPDCWQPCLGLQQDIQAVAPHPVP